MDIFAGMQPRSGPLPIEGDSQQPIRNFLSGFQMRQQQQEMALKTKEVASNLVHQDLQNRLAQRNLDLQTQASTEMAGWNDLSDEDVLKLRPNGNPFRDRPLEQFQNSATSKIQAKASNGLKMKATLIGQTLADVNFKDALLYFDSFKDGMPTPASADIIDRNQEAIKSYEAEQARLKPSVQAQQLRSETQQSISDEANATRLKIAEMKIGNKSVDPEVNRRMYLLNHLRLREMNADLEAVKSQEALAMKLPTEKKRNEAMSEVNASREQTMNKWRGIMDDLEKSSSQATNTAPSNGPSQTDIDYLKSNPSVKDRFNLRFGSGTAEQYLGQ